MSSVKKRLQAHSKDKPTRITEIFHEKQLAVPRGIEPLFPG